MMKVAIAKSRIYKGGVTQVLASMIQVLNENGIIPDLVTLRCDVNEESVQKNYGQNIRFKIRKVAPDLKIPYEWHFLYFNFISRRALKKYDLIIDSNNTSFLSQSKIPSINYTHYPRKDRVISDLYSLHLPEGPKKKLIDIRTDPFFIAKFLYKFNKNIKDNEKIICNSVYTAGKVSEVYPVKTEEMEVLYPPVQLPQEKYFSKVPMTVVSLGRFSEEKRQLEQIEIAKKLPEYQFRILGFSGDGSYVKKCQAKIKDENISNVEILPDIDFAAIEKIMKESQFFIHNVRNEPFGISTVQAIAHGCIPIVHNSGGSREIVKMENLMFTDFVNCIEKFNSLKTRSNNELNEILSQINLTEYSRDYFMKRFNFILSQYFA